MARLLEGARRRVECQNGRDVEPPAGVIARPATRAAAIQIRVSKRRTWIASSLRASQ